ncbi:unnamed protein product [Cunninghamella blakesleeana]
MELIKKAKFQLLCATVGGCEYDVSIKKHTPEPGESVYDNIEDVDHYGYYRLTVDDNKFYGVLHTLN